MLCQLGQEPDLFIKNRSHTVGDMLLMRAVDRHALLAVAVITAGFLTGTVIFVLVFLSELSCKFFLKPQSLLPVSFVEFFHCVKLFLVTFDDHLFISFV